MKKGTFSLIISLLVGLGYVLYCFSSHHYPFITEPFRIFQFTVTLPKLLVPADLLMVILAVFVNLCALVTGTSSLAAGAAVFYGVSAGFRPDSYPYVIVPFLLCILAAARMRHGTERGQSGEYAQGKAADPKTAVHYSDSAAQISAKTRKSAGGSPEGQSIVYHFGENRNASPTTQSIEDIRKKFDHYDNPDAGVWKYWFFGILVALVVLIVVGTFLKTDTGRQQKQTENSLRKWDLSISTAGDGSGSADQGAGSRNDGSGGSAGDGSGSADQGAGSRNDGSAGSGSADGNGSGKPEDGGNASDGIPDLTGSWMMNEDTPGAMANMRAVISDDTISMYWIMENGSDMLYWEGSFEPPETAESPYTWVSVKNPDKNSAFSSKEETKSFTYRYVDGGPGDIISFPMSSGSGIRFQLHRMSVSDWIRS